MDVDAQFPRDELSERSFAEAGRAEEERVIQRFAAGEGGVDIDAQTLLDLLLANELVKTLRPE